MTRQRTLAEVRAAGPKEVSDWLRAGELDALRSGYDPVSGPEIDAAERRAAEEPAATGSADLGARGDLPQGQLSRADLQGMSATAIVRAHREGRLDAAKRGEA